MKGISSRMKNLKECLFYEKKKDGKSDVHYASIIV